MGWAISFLWLMQILDAAIWGTTAIAAYLRYRRWEISIGVIAIGVSLSLLRAYYLLPDFGLALAAVLLLVYVVATSVGKSGSTIRMAPPSDDEQQVAKVEPGGARGFAVFLFGGFSFYAVVCLLTLVTVMRNRNPDNWGVFMPIVIGVWGIPIFGTLAAILHAWTGPWAWLSNRRAWLNATYAFLTCILLWVVIIMTQ